MNKKIIFLIVIFFIFESVIRLWQLAAIPSGFQADEAAFGYIEPN